LSVLVLILGARPVAAQGPGNIEVRGFLLGGVTGRLSDAGPEGPKDDFMLGEGRLRLDLTAWSESVEAAARVKTDVVHDAVDGQVDLDVREAYVDYTAGAFDFRLGRQIATWGVGDLVFINDVFPGSPSSRAGPWSI
jgi:hypothetical protein